MRYYIVYGIWDSVVGLSKETDYENSSYRNRTDGKWTG